MYNNYINFVRSVVKHNDLSLFKSNDHYRSILEHVSKEQGNEYLYYILNKTNIHVDDIFEFCKINDTYGGTIKEIFYIKGKELYTSPTNLRYIYHSYHILNYFSSIKNNINLIEVGGGYGGLCLAISYFLKYFEIHIQNYNIIDLEDITKLQDLYLSKHTLNFNVIFHASNSYGINVENNDNNFLISNYCFSEIEDVYQKEYIKNLFSKIQHGFMVWNHIPVYDFGFQIKIEEEYPQTDSMRKMNKYVYF